MGDIPWTYIGSELTANVRENTGFASVSTFDFRATTGPSFDPSASLFPASFVLEEFNEEHFVIWTKMNQNNGDYGFMTLLPEFYPRVVFNSEKSRDDFINWYNQYRRLFPNGDTTKYLTPPMPTGEFSGFFVERKLPENARPSIYNPRHHVYFEEWCWVLANSRDKSWFSQTHILFANQSDAVAYRLKWG
jgi:hypothetical protein